MQYFLEKAENVDDVLGEREHNLYTVLPFVIQHSNASENWKKQESLLLSSVSFVGLPFPQLS